MLKFASLYALVMVWLCLSGLATWVRAEASDVGFVGKASDKDRATINRSTHAVWFDSDHQTVQPIRASKSINVEDRHSSIAGTAQSSPPGWWSAFRVSLSNFFSWIFRSWQILLLVSLLVLLLVVGFIVFRYGLSFQALAARIADGSVREKEKAKLQELPFEVEPTMFGLLAQAERYRAAGDFSKAIIYLFSYALVEMDSARCIRLARGKTNRAYLRELSEHDNLRSFTNQLVLAFEFAFFGKHVLSQETFESIWQQVPAFDAYLKQIHSKPSTSLSLIPARVS